MGDTVEAMVDIETLDTRGSSVVYQVGVIVFQGNDLLYSKEYNMQLDQQLECNRTVSEDTLKFHLSAPQGLAISLNSLERTTVQELMNHLKTANKFKPKYWWAKGSFDFDILEDLLNNQVPWMWYQKMELRTLIRETGADKPEPSHSGLADCLIQLKQLQQCREIIRDGTARDESEERDQQGSTQADSE